MKAEERDLMMLLQGKAEMIIRTKDSSQWTSTSQKHVNRDWSRRKTSQLTLELVELKKELADDPDSTSDKIRTVLLKAGPDINRIRLNRLKLDKFMEVIR